MTKISLLSLRKVLLLSASFFLLAIACKREGELDPDFIQRTSSSFFADSILIEANTIRGDSILASQVATGLVGVYQDSAFGRTTASLYLQPLLESNSIVLAEPTEELLLDSVVLSLEYEDFFGDTTSLHGIYVHELEDLLDEETRYFSDTSIAVVPTPLGRIEFIPRPLTSLTINQPNSSGGIDTIPLDPQLRIRLSDDLGERILSKSGQVELSSNNDFTNYFRGIKISPDLSMPLSNNEKSILYFALTSSETKLTVYYKVVSQQADTAARLLNFPINSTSVRFSTFENDYSQAAVLSNLNDGKKDSLFSFVQAMAGVETVLSFPDIKERLSNDKIIINKAELVLPVASGSYDEFGVASTLILAIRDEQGILNFTPDFNEGVDFFGGVFDELRRTYTFNIARYLQGVLNETERPEGLTILVTGGAVKAERVVLLSPGNEDRRIKLNLFYSKTE